MRMSGDLAAIKASFIKISIFFYVQNYILKIHKIHVLIN